ncbi:hypothetical protein [Cellulomonas sp. URHE0023]|uniref:hypothetical protein n=1 Tax=Cellulomonas sp. URHE0023 TaxID=1380354 RepID=UPI0004834A82|nr:hypothetical protein [Cellulomonas sp. URHE0023]
MSAEVTTIGRDAQYEVGGLLVGIVVVKPLDPQDPDDAVMLALTDPALGESVQVILRPGRASEWLGRRVEVLSLQREPVKVELSVEPATVPLRDAGAGGSQPPLEH